MRSSFRWCLVGITASFLMAAGVQAATLTTLHSFSGSDGSLVWSGLIADANGTLFGTTALGGASDHGTIFRFDIEGGLTTLHSFSGSDGKQPFSNLLFDTSGNLFGTTSYGGAHNQGTIFRLNASGGLTILHSFSGGDGRVPGAGLIADANGNFFGTTGQGGTSDNGTIFRLDAGGNLTTLHNFSFIDGSQPVSGLFADANGNLFGTAALGGASNNGTIFRLDASGGFSVLHSFSGGDGSEPEGSLVSDASGNLYGTTRSGGVSFRGTIFRLNVSSGLTTLHSFSPTYLQRDGRNPLGGLLIDAQGNLFGTTAEGGGPNAGTIFRYSANAPLATLHTFSGSPRGGNPTSGLLADASGNLFGTTSDEVQSGFGTIFRLSDAGFAVVPEPASWAMLITGFGAIGAALRVRRRHEQADPSPG